MSAHANPAASPRLAPAAVMTQKVRALSQLARNRRLDSFFVRNLNAEPDGWALAERSFDAVLCCVSVQYLQQVGGAAPTWSPQTPESCSLALPR